MKSWLNKILDKLNSYEGYTHLSHRCDRWFPLVGKYPLIGSWEQQFQPPDIGYSLTPEGGKVAASHREYPVKKSEEFNN